MYNLPIVPDNFKVPQVLETERMRLRPLTMADAEKDYEAVMSSERRLKTVFRENGDWPTGLTLDQDIMELGWHQTEFELRTSFAYTVVSLDESRVLGSVYVLPAFHPDYDVQVTLWVRESEAGTGLDAHLYETVRTWIDGAWPFERPVYPGRTVDWEEWVKDNRL